MIHAACSHPESIAEPALTPLLVCTETVPTAVTLALLENDKSQPLVETQQMTLS